LYKSTGCLAHIPRCENSKRDVRRRSLNCQHEFRKQHSEMCQERDNLTWRFTT